MNCYNCGQGFTSEDFCPACKADLRAYKITAVASNRYYNLALEKAQVRDLSGAMRDLKMSLTFNKKNVEARNLLGLVLYEMGEIVEALSQWVISKNIRPEKNIAKKYIKDVQNSQGKFDVITKAIYKYNVALEYAKEGNHDMALIQLKKVTNVHPKYVKAQLLTALLYLNLDDIPRAKKALKGVTDVDKYNTLALHYNREIKLMEIAKKQNASQDNFLPKKQEKEIIDNAPLSGNDVIVPISTYKEPSNGAITIINILLGVVIGAALIWFLIIPARYRGMTEEYNNTIAEYSEKLSSSNVELNQLERELKLVKEEKEKLETQLGDVSGEGGANKMLTMLINATNHYIEGDKVAAAEAIKGFTADDLSSDNSKKLYSTISSATFVPASQELYNQATDQFNAGNKKNSAELYVRSYELNKDFAEAAFYAAQAYRDAEDNDNALKYFKIVVDNFPNSGFFAEASAYVATH